MSIKEIETGYETLYQAVEQYQNMTKQMFYSAYIEVMEGITAIDFPVEKDDKMFDYYQTLRQLPLLPEEKRKVTQLVLLKGMTLEPLQPNHQLTPDSIGFLFVYLIETLSHHAKSLRLYDPCNGMGNLLATVMLNLNLADIKTEGFGSEIDDILIRIAAVNADWMEMPVRLFHQDGTQPVMMEPCDFVVCDLPIGYYPLDDRVANFVTAHDEGHSYAHHVLMEAAMKQLNAKGYGLFIVPSQFLMSEQADDIKRWLNQDVYIQAMLHLPSAMFKTEASQKSILILQNRNDETVQSKALVAEIPSLNDREGLERFFATFAKWNTERKGEQ